MNNNQGFALYYVLICSAIFSVTCDGAYASDSDDIETLNAFADSRYTQPPYKVVHALTSKCRRYGVVWSGGVASRFPNRISPRPIRSRWDRDVDNRIRCDEVDAFNQRRVSDQPMIR